MTKTEYDIEAVKQLLIDEMYKQIPTELTQAERRRLERRYRLHRIGWTILRAFRIR